MVDIKKLSTGVAAAGKHYKESITGKPAPAVPTRHVPRPVPTPLTATQRTQMAGNAVKLREAARRNANPGMSAQQANEMERHSGLMATLPKRTTTSKTPTSRKKAAPKKKKK